MLRLNLHVRDAQTLCSILVLHIVSVICYQRYVIIIGGEWLAELGQWEAL